MLVEVIICWFTCRNAFHTYIQNTDNSTKGKRLVPSKIYTGNWIGSDKKFQSENHKNPSYSSNQVGIKPSSVWCKCHNCQKKTNHESMKL